MSSGIVLFCSSSTVHAVAHQSGYVLHFVKEVLVIWQAERGMSTVDDEVHQTGITIH